jgi:hypothetical protein
LGDLLDQIIANGYLAQTPPHALEQTYQNGNKIDFGLNLEHL